MALSIGTDGYRFNASYETCTSSGSTCQDFASVTNDVELITMCVCLFNPSRGFFGKVAPLPWSFF